MVTARELNAAAGRKPPYSQSLSHSQNKPPPGKRVACSGQPRAPPTFLSQHNKGLFICHSGLRATVHDTSASLLNSTCHSLPELGCCPGREFQITAENADSLNGGDPPVKDPLCAPTGPRRAGFFSPHPTRVWALLLQPQFTSPLSKFTDFTSPGDQIADLAVAVRRWEQQALSTLQAEL